jgi:dipeptide/tripeptide permease
MNYSDTIEPDERTPLVRGGEIINDTAQIQINPSDDNQRVPFFDHRKTWVRVLVLFLICFLLFGTYFCYVQTGALQNEFQRDLKITTSQFTVFNSLYSWPNILLCFFGGYLIDKLLGHRLGAILFSCFVSLGQLALAFGAFKKNVFFMYIATFLFG